MDLIWQFLHFAPNIVSTKISPLAYLEFFFFNCEVFEDVENNTEEGEEDSVEEMLKVEMLFEESKFGMLLEFSKVIVHHCSKIL